jgi:hypothetical protein
LATTEQNSNPQVSLWHLPLCGRAIARLLVAGFPPRRAEFDPRSGHLGIVVDKVALGQVSFEYFGSHCQFSFHRLFHTHHLSSVAGTIGQIVADVPSGLTVSPHSQETKKNNYFVF